MSTLTTLRSYSDDNGNIIDFAGKVSEKIRIFFKGRNNRLIVDSPFKLDRLIIRFECDNATVRIGANDGSVGAFGVSMRVGQDCNVRIGKNVSVTQNLFMSVAEGASITIGDDCMIASNNEIRADDSHPIFDVETGARVNPSQSIVIGDHVWIAKNAVVMGGVTIGEGTVIGYASTVTRDIPNNVIAVGSPTKVTRRNIAWERPGLSTARPYYKPNADVIKKKSPHWGTTKAVDQPTGISKANVSHANSALAQSERIDLVNLTARIDQIGRLVEDSENDDVESLRFDLNQALIAIQSIASEFYKVADTLTKAQASLSAAD